LSDHLGVEAVLNLTTEHSLAGAMEPAFKGPGVLNVVSEHRTYVGGN
jgi:hypothetical protein